MSELSSEVRSEARTARRARRGRGRGARRGTRPAGPGLDAGATRRPEPPRRRRPGGAGRPAGRGSPPSWCCWSSARRCRCAASRSGSWSGCSSSCPWTSSRPGIRRFGFDAKRYALYADRPGHPRRPGRPGRPRAAPALVGAGPAGAGPGPVALRDAGGDAPDQRRPVRRRPGQRDDGRRRGLPRGGPGLRRGAGPVPGGASTGPASRLPDLARRPGRGSSPAGPAGRRRTSWGAPSAALGLTVLRPALRPPPAPARGGRPRPPGAHPLRGPRRPPGPPHPAQLRAAAPAHAHATAAGRPASAPGGSAEPPPPRRLARDQDGAALPSGRTPGQLARAHHEQRGLLHRDQERRGRPGAGRRRSGACASTARSGARWRWTTPACAACRRWR